MDQAEYMRMLGFDTKKTKVSSAKSILKYPGNKAKHLDSLLPHLPYRGAWIDVFGGSGIVTFARRRSKLEVYNDRYSGVVNFMRQVRDNCDALVARLELTLHSREEWEECLRTWEHPTLTDLERAARWYTYTIFSFGSLGRNFGYDAKASGASATSLVIARKLPHFPMIHERLKGVLIENCDWSECFKVFDSPDAVFYLDPPYLPGTHVHTYACNMTRDDHARMLDQIFRLRGYVALSGYANDLYDSFAYKWTKRIEWDRTDTLRARSEDNQDEVRGKVKEVLWIKE